MVGCGCYRIVGDSLVHNSQETILMARIASSMVKTMSKKSKLMILSLNVLTFLRLIFSLNCLIRWQLRTWHHFFCWQNRRKTFFNLKHLCHQSHPPCGEYLICCFLLTCDGATRPPTSYGVWIMTISFCKKSNSYWLLLMGTSCLNYHPSIQMLTTLFKCKAWTEIRWPRLE